jgi:hypothetical protein
MGDGHTSSGFPTQLAGGRGVYFDTADWIDLDWTAGGALDTTSLTFLAHCRPTYLGSDRRLFTIGITGQAYDLFFDAVDGLTFKVDDVVDTELNTGVLADERDMVAAVAIDSSGASVFVDGKRLASFSGDIRIPSMDVSSEAFIGQTLTASNRYLGDVYSSAIYPGALSQAQVREWGRRARQLRNI